MNSLISDFFKGKSKITAALQVIGITIVIAVNLFVFGSDFLAKNFGYLPSYEKFFLHAAQEHRVNQSPFSLSWHFTMSPAPLMEPSSDKPLIIFQRITSALFAVSFIVFVLYFISIILLREDTKRTLFIPAIIIPPPKRF